MVRFRNDIEHIAAYQPGRPAADVMREYDLDEVVKLASNECPYPPFPEVVAAIRREAGSANRYPDNRSHELAQAVSSLLDVAPERLLFGGGSSFLLLTAALAMGGPGTSAVFAVPSFPLYRKATQIAHSEPIPVALDGEHRHDPAAMLAAVRADTTLVYLCNPNNPTGTHLGADAVAAFVEGVTDDVLIIVDEAYSEFVPAPDFDTALPLTRKRNNVIVARSFSKVYGLAGLRVGYFVGDPETLATIRRVRIPFTVNTLAQAAAIEALKHQDRVAERIQANAHQMKVVMDGLAARGIEAADSQTNFVYFFPPMDATDLIQGLLQRGVIIREAGMDAVRLTIGTEEENQRFFEVLDELI
jgi:histidinol-phosphate aminotransferase